jgi:hypothetical protein
MQALGPPLPLASQVYTLGMQLVVEEVTCYHIRQLCVGLNATGHNTSVSYEARVYSSTLVVC